MDSTSLSCLGDIRNLFPHKNIQYPAREHHAELCRMLLESGVVVSCVMMPTDTSLMLTTRRSEDPERRSTALEPVQLPLNAGNADPMDREQHLEILVRPCMHQ